MKRKIAAILCAVMLLGLLAACGRGKLAPGDVPALLAAADRAAVAAPTAPPRGLALACVEYGPAYSCP